MSNTWDDDILIASKVMVSFFHPQTGPIKETYDLFSAHDRACWMANEKISALYTPSQFCQAFENKAGLGGNHSIRDRIDVLATKGYVKFNKDNAAKSKYGVMCVEGMEVPAGEETVDPDTGEVSAPMRPLLPTHFKAPGNGAILPVENPSVWVYQEEETA